MFKHMVTRQKERAEGRPASNMSSLWFRVAVVSGTAAAVGAGVVPVLAMGASTLGAEAYSHVTRSSALMAYMLLWVTMLAGLSVTGKVGRKWPGMASSFGVHRYTSLLGLGFAVVHALALLGDPYMGYTPVGLLVPFMAGGYQPHWLGLGQVAIYLLAAVSLSFYVRDRLGVRAWRLVHSLSFALFLMALMHGLHSGSDSGTWWASGLYW